MASAKFAVRSADGENSKSIALTHTDEKWIRHAMELAHRAEEHGEVPVGAVLIKDGEIIAEGWNQPIDCHDPSAHAEIKALRQAGERLSNYRLPGTTLYCTLEPCVMCAGAIIHARVERIVFGAYDPKAGACGSVFDLLPSDERFNHQTQVTGGVLADQCGDQLRAFFRRKRKPGSGHPTVI